MAGNTGASTASHHCGKLWLGGCKEFAQVSISYADTETDASEAECRTLCKETEKCGLVFISIAKKCHFYREEAVSICTRWDSDGSHVAYSVNECSKGQLCLISDLSELYTASLISIYILIPPW